MTEAPLWITVWEKVLYCCMAIQIPIHFPTGRYKHAWGSWGENRASAWPCPWTLRDRSAFHKYGLFEGLENSTRRSQGSSGNLIQRNYGPKEGTAMTSGLCLWLWLLYDFIWLRRLRLRPITSERSSLLWNGDAAKHLSDTDLPSLQSALWVTEEHFMCWNIKDELPLLVSENPE